MINIEVRHDYRRDNRTCEILLRHSTIESGDITVGKRFPWNILLAGIQGEDAGRITDVKSGREFILEKNRYCLIPKNCDAYYHLKPELHFINLQFNIERYPGVDLFDRQPGILSGSSPQWIGKFLRILHMPYSTASFLLLKSALMEFSIEELRPDFSSSSLPEDAQGILQYIIRNHSAEMSVKTVADHVHMSPPAFSRKFKKLLGKTPKEYLDQILLERTMPLLHTELTLAGIAKKLHFSSEFQLSRFLLRMTGLSPSVLRKQPF